MDSAVKSYDFNLGTVNMQHISISAAFNSSFIEVINITKKPVPQET
jgi:hypothetical protein